MTSYKMISAVFAELVARNQLAASAFGCPMFDAGEVVAPPATDELASQPGRITACEHSDGVRPDPDDPGRFQAADCRMPLMLEGFVFVCS